MKYISLALTELGRLGGNVEKRLHLGQLVQIDLALHFPGALDFIGGREGTQLFVDQHPSRLGRLNALVVAHVVVHIIGYIEIISDGLQAAATLDRSVLDALPVQNIIFLPEKLKIGPVDKVVDGQQSAALAADQEHLRTTVADVLCN